MTIIDRFTFANHHYVIELTNGSLMFYREELDGFSFFSEPIKSSIITNDIKSPTTLLRMIARKVTRYLYDNRIKYFYLTVDDTKRKRIYENFLSGLAEYNYQVTDDIINVSKV